MSPGQADKEVLRRHLMALRAAIERLRGYQTVPLDALRQDGGLRWAVERGLQVAAQNVLDLATHVVASAGHDVPDYASALDALGDLGVLPAEFVAEFRAVAGLRNVLVHGYLEVDLVIVHRVISTRLASFERFADALEGLLGAPKEGGGQGGRSGRGAS